MQLNTNLIYSRKNGITYLGDLPLVKFDRVFPDVKILGLETIEYTNRYIKANLTNGTIEILNPHPDHENDNPEPEQLSFF